MKGIFERRADNPVGDWNWVYIPYCTGDVHGGNNDNGTYTDGGAVQRYVGYKNVEKFLERIVPTFPNVTHVLQTGSSARIRRGSQCGAPRGQIPEHREIDLDRRLGAAVLEDVPAVAFAEAVAHDAGIRPDVSGHVRRRLPGSRRLRAGVGSTPAQDFSEQLRRLVSSAHDGIISLYFGLGQNSCTVDPTVQPPPVPPAEFGAGLMDLRAKMKAVSNRFGTYYIPGSKLHVWLVDDKFYETEVDGVKLDDWTRDLLNDKAAHVGNAALSSDAGTDGG